MRFERLLEVVGDEPVFETGLLLAGDVDPDDVRRQLSRWVTSGRIYSLRRGLYSLAPPYTRDTPHPYVVANRLARPSYVSLQTALGHYGLIPEYVPVTMSVTTGRPRLYATPLGRFSFRHVQSSLFWGYGSVELGRAKTAFLATPEKALLDLIYLEPGGDAPAYLVQLRLQNLDRLSSDRLTAWADRYPGAKLRRAAQAVEALRRAESAEYRPL